MTIRNIILVGLALLTMSTSLFGWFSYDKNVELRQQIATQKDLLKFYETKRQEMQKQDQRLNIQLAKMQFKLNRKTREKIGRASCRERV